MSAPAERRGLAAKLRGIMSAPGQMLGLDRSARDLSADWAALRRPMDRNDDRVRLDDDRGVDMPASAFLHGMRVAAFETALDERRRQTAHNAWIFFGLGVLFGVFWLFRLATLQGWSLISALQFAPVEAVFLLLAFKFGLQNYQIRERRIAGAQEYLLAGRDFWPR